MKNAVVLYTTKHGSVKGCAEKLAGLLGPETQVVDVKKAPSFDIEPFSTVVLGGSIYMGSIQKAMRAFCSRNQERLMQKKLGLYICCMAEGEKAQEQLRKAFGERLASHATARGCLGGAFDIGSMNPFERMIVKIVGKADQSVSKISETSISSFVSELLR